MKNLIKSKRFFLNPSKKDEGGSMMIMAYMSLMLFLLFTVLMLDVPYLEKVSRSMQNSLDSAALAGSIQLTLRSIVNPDSSPNDIERIRGWKNSKRAVFALLASNPITGARSINFSPVNPVKADGTNVDASDEDPLDPDTPAPERYGYEHYNVSEGGINARLTISRGVYHRPNNWQAGQSITTFYSVEIGSANRPLDKNDTRCITAASPDSPIHEFPIGDQHVNEPTECRPNPQNPRVIDIADSVLVKLEISNIPTLFARLLGVNSFQAMTREAVSVPE